MNSHYDPAIPEWIGRHRNEMLALLRRLVETNSYTTYKAGVDKVADILIGEFRKYQLEIKRIENSYLGDAIIATPKWMTADEKGVLLCGHMDTVFPPDHPFQAYREEGEFAFGPGVIDMKGGLVAMLYAWLALNEAGFCLPTRFLLIPDEETGSMHSRELILSLARQSEFALVFECSGEEGQTAVGRKGKLSFRLDVKGRAGHVADSAYNKASANLALANKIIAIESLNDAEKGINVNVGRIEGGIGPNSVSENAFALIDSRFPNREDGQWLESKLSEIADGCDVGGTSAKVVLMSRRDSMEPTKGNTFLSEIFEKTAKSLGFQYSKEIRNGVSDANFIAETGIPVIDGLGPSGRDDHSDRERMNLNSLTERTILAALGMKECWNALRNIPPEH
ncbi:M20 family metallopeptidase [bacterium]|nr:M20 family metallopeptidase [bacterium]